MKVSRPASPAPPKSRCSAGLKEGDEIVTGSYKMLRTLRNGAGVQKETGSRSMNTGGVLK